MCDWMKSGLWSQGVILDYDEEGVVIGVEFLNAAARTKNKILPKLDFQTA